MGISIWQVLLVIVILAILFVIPGIAIATEKSSDRIGRKDFAIASLLFFVAYATLNRIFSRIFETMGDVGLALNIALILVFFFVWYKYTKLVVRRARDAGLHQKYCYIFVIPIVSLFFVIFLMIKKAAPTVTPSDL